MSRFIQETQMFQKRKTFNVFVSCLMAFNGLFNGCLLPLLHPHTPINTEASIHYQHEKSHENHRTKIIHTKKNLQENKTLQRRCPEFSKPKQSLRSKVPTPRSPQIKSAYIQEVPRSEVPAPRSAQIESACAQKSQIESAPIQPVPKSKTQSAGKKG